jgi:Tfp pilus assembly protein PilO
MKFLMPIILIGISLGVFFVFTNPIYDDISHLRTQVASYNEALDNSKALENERDKLTAKYNSINRDDLAKLQTLLPENVDNIRLVLEIEQLALPYGMVLKDIKYNTTTEQDLKKSNTAASLGAVQGGGLTQISRKDYGVWDLEFSTTGTYNNFLNFTKDLESNLRIVDISSIVFSSASSSDINTKINLPVNSPSSSEVYRYGFKIKTYWLKN